MRDKTDQTALKLSSAARPLASHLSATYPDNLNRQTRLANQPRRCAAGEGVSKVTPTHTQALFEGNDQKTTGPQFLQGFSAFWPESTPPMACPVLAFDGLVRPILSDSGRVHGGIGAFRTGEAPQRVSTLPFQGTQTVTGPGGRRSPSTSQRFPAPRRRISAPRKGMARHRAYAAHRGPSPPARHRHAAQGRSC